MSQRSMPTGARIPRDQVGRIRNNGWLHCRSGGRRIELQTSIAFAG